MSNARTLAILNAPYRQQLGAVFQRYRWSVVAAFVLNLLAALFEGNTLLFISIAIATITEADMTSTWATLGPLAAPLEAVYAQFDTTAFFLLMIGITIGSQLLRSLLIFSSTAVAIRLTANIEASIRQDLFQQYLDISYTDFRKHGLGELVTLISYAHRVGKFLLRINGIIYSLLTLLIYVALMMFLSFTTSLITVLIFAPVGFFLLRFIVSIRAESKRMAIAATDLNGYVAEYVQGVQIIHAFVQQVRAKEIVSEIIERYRRASWRSQIYLQVITPTIEVIGIIAVSLLLVTGLWISERNPSVTLSTLFTFVLILWRAVPRLSAMMNEYSYINETWPYIQMIFDMLNREDKAYPALGSQPFDELNDKIVFDRVRFQYDDAEIPALDDVSFAIERGKMTALVGASGGGKSSVLSLLLRLYAPSNGNILVDGTSLDTLNINDWRRSIGFVGQDPFLFSLSIRDNISFAKPEATDEEIIAAAKAANAHDFIAAMPQSYQTMVDERGQRLSGGQRQRIALARALIHNPSLLILDEATSALDSQSEQKIIQMIDELRDNRTIIAIAHRLSTINNADKILVMEDGCIVESGTHNELLAQDGTYAHYWHIQSDEVLER